MGARDLRLALLVLAPVLVVRTLFALLGFEILRYKHHLWPK
jgi:hypothetical protein